MIHPLIRLLISQPQMVADHVEAYAELVTEEVGGATQRLKRRLLLHAASLVGIVLGVLFGAVALMLWASSPDDTMRAPWVLWAVPGVPLLAGIACHFAARKRDDEPHGMAVIREQLAADAEMLRSVGAGS
jgi:hypothetical protein